MKWFYLIGCIGAVGYTAMAQPTQGRDFTSGRVVQPAEPVVTVTNGRLSMDVHNRPLGWVLDQLLQAGSVPILSTGNVADDLISIELKNVPLDEGIRLILRRYDAFFFHGASGDSQVSLKMVWVYPAGRGTGIQPVPFEVWASTKELEGQLDDPAPDIRARAYEGLIERKHRGAIDMILRALKEEKDTNVRTRVFYAALKRNVELPADVLIALVYSDSSDVVRLLSLNNLEGDPSLRGVAMTALRDTSPNVRNRAKEILEQLDRATRPVDPPRP